MIAVIITAADLRSEDRRLNPPLEAFTRTAHMRDLVRACDVVLYERRTSLIEPDERDAVHHTAPVTSWLAVKSRDREPGTIVGVHLVSEIVAGCDVSSARVALGDLGIREARS